MCHGRDTFPEPVCATEASRGDGGSPSQCDSHPPECCAGGGFHSGCQLVLQADPQLAIGFVDGVDGIDSVPTEVVRCMLQVVLRAGKRTKRSVDLRVIPPSWGW